MRALRQPAVLGELLGGIFLGPTVLGTLAPHVYAWLFPATGPTTVGRDALLKIGMLFFMFVAGLEVNPPTCTSAAEASLGPACWVLCCPVVWGSVPFYLCQRCGVRRPRSISGSLLSSWVWPYPSRRCQSLPESYWICL
jgi:Kef-type K+ transport system membrane component KefB